MKIQSCYIENFGTLSKFSMDFNNGLNAILKENGWGKTTLAAFIKAMLFGMESSRAHQNERKKYTPWNGGKFGGNLCFEVNGKTYRVERSFGKTDKSDTFMLYDLKTNLESKDYSEKLGEEILGVDRESFEKSVFIQVSDRENTLLTDIMSARMADTIFDSNDMDKLNEVITMLDKKSAKIKAKRGNGGTLSELKNQLAETEEEIKECDAAIASMEAEQSKVREYETSLAEAKVRSKAAADGIDSYRFAEKKNEYIRIRTEYKESVDNRETQERFFKGDIPTEEVISEMEEHINEYNIYAAIAKDTKVTPEEKQRAEELQEFFKDGVPTDEEFAIVQQDIVMLATANQKSLATIPDTRDIVRLGQLRERFGLGVVSDAKIDQIIEKYENISNLEKSLESYQGEIDTIQDTVSQNTNRYRSLMLTLFVVSGVVVALGLVILLFVNTFLGIGLEIGGLVAAIAGLMLIKPQKEEKAASATGELQQKSADIQVRIERDRLECKNFIRTYGRDGDESSPIKALGDIRSDSREYYELENKISVMNEEHAETLREVKDINGRLEDFMNRYFQDGTPSKYSDYLLEIRNNAEDFQKLKDMIDSYNDAVKTAMEHKNVLYAFIEKYFSTVKRPSEQMKLISKNLDDFNRLKEEEAKKLAVLEEFKAKNDTEALEALELPAESLEELNELQQKAAEDISSVTSFITGCRHKMEEYAVVADRKEDLEASVANIREQIAAMDKKLEILNLTKELLKKSGDALSERYMSDIAKAFNKYAGMIKEDMHDFQIDMNLEVKKDKDGVLHDSSSFSAGEKDMTELCVRLSLLDAVYKDGEKPVIVLDDPFVNLDDDRIGNAMKLVKNLAGEYQVIYFACHESRMKNLR